MGKWRAPGWSGPTWEREAWPEGTRHLEGENMQVNVGMKAMDPLEQARRELQ